MAKKSTKKQSTTSAAPETVTAPTPKTAKKTTKKSTKKAATRKATKKRATKKTAKGSPSTEKKAGEKAAKAAALAMQDIIARARDHFRQAPSERVFYLVDGRTLKDLRDLAEAMEDMAEHVFNHHVTDDRHDFANWVHEVLQERALAEEMRSAHQHPKDHQHVIYRHIVRRVW